MYAIFETGGKQYKAAKGEIVFVEKLAEEPGKTVSFDALVVADGADVKIGTPIVKGAKVKAKVIEHGKEKKVVVFKYKAKRNYRKKQGHRQPFTKLKITSITTAKEKEEKEAAAE
ncbi:MAG: 50S ribosomal protein L21 [Eubacteriales bacterium]|nr:50S ribosomal protein L21 [Eubacteriales bacterium]